ncbi:exocyst complex subunit Sec15-like-domain-containing protein [Elsinoe ampelina]|uniref:Exocyst complex component SEC15 n=1 Tax=Elsinoe ampelina TaxID=302913 RepID=A0A6A6G1Y4_9PEZI|nr:exocyst complex subunit Sec15-like-domain-containing protein [Elsinoe ampelina]
MPAFYEPHEEYIGAVQQIVLSSSDADYLDQLIPIIRDVNNPDKANNLMQALNQVSGERESEIERICNSNHQDFINSVKQLQSVREGTMSLTAEIMNLSQSIESSTERLAQQKKALVDSRGVRHNIDETSQALKDCLEVLRLSNQVHDLLAKKNHYAALRALDELKHVHLREVTRYKIAEMIEQSVPATQRMIADAVMRDLNTWLYRLREVSQFLGEMAFYQTGLRRDRLKERTEQNELFTGLRLNSAVETVADESEEFDMLNNDDVQVDFTPLFEALYIHDALGETEKFRQEYAATRREQNDRLIPQRGLDLVDEEANELSSLLESIAGFAFIEKATLERTENLRTSTDIDELWDNMCQKSINLIVSALPTVTSDEKLLRIKSVVALFIQTVDSWGYPVTLFDKLTVTLFEKYADLLKQRFSEDFSEVVSTDDYMPMPINNPEEYQKVLDVSWYTPDADQAVQFPCVLPFSQMYPLCCIDIRNFLNQMYLFSDDHFQNASLIDDTLKTSLDDLLSDKVCASLVERLSSQYPGQIVQILTNLDHFERACHELQSLLVEARSSSSAAGAITLRATQLFAEAKKKAERRIFELVNSKIDDLVENDEYDWTSAIPPDEVSMYMSELTRYLSNIMTSVLLGLPAQIKELIYFDALSHISSSILRLPLDDRVRRISPQAVRAYGLDVNHLVDFVRSQDTNASLLAGLEELQQTKDLMSLAASPDGRAEEEFFDAERSRKRFGKVDRANGALLLEKISQGVAQAAADARAATQSPPAQERRGMNMPNMNFGGFSSRFGNLNRGG